MTSTLGPHMMRDVLDEISRLFELEEPVFVREE